jgi:pimeloyl-ACP methyl ester carboxylesterase
VRRFGFLLTQGSSSARIDTQRLRRCYSPSTLPPDHVLDQGLRWLAELDLRMQIARLELPSLHLYGESDALVTARVADAMRESCSTSARVDVVQGMGHLPCGFFARTILTRMTAYLSGVTLC